MHGKRRLADEGYSEFAHKGHPDKRERIGFGSTNKLEEAVFAAMDEGVPAYFRFAAWTRLVMLWGSSHFDDTPEHCHLYNFPQCGGTHGVPYQFQQISVITYDALCIRRFAQEHWIGLKPARGSPVTFHDFFPHRQTGGFIHGRPKHTRACLCGIGQMLIN